MIWILIAMSTGGYNYGTISGIEFNNQRACIEAREVMKNNGLDVKTICIKKGEGKNNG